MFVYGAFSNHFDFATDQRRDEDMVSIENLLIMHTAKIKVDQMLAVGAYNSWYNPPF